MRCKKNQHRSLLNNVNTPNKFPWGFWQLAIYKNQNMEVTQIIIKRVQQAGPSSAQTGIGLYLY